MTSPSRSSASHSSSSARSSSGWNCSASARPSTNACDELAVRAISVAPGGSVQRSKCHWNHGPPGTRSGLSLFTSYQPISGVSDRATEPPNACASSWPPKQTPRVGTPASAASRTSCHLGAHPGAAQRVVVHRPTGAQRDDDVVADGVGEAHLDRGVVDTIGGHHLEGVDVEAAVGERLAEQRLGGEMLVAEEQHGGRHGRYCPGGIGGASSGASSAPILRNSVSASLR